LEAGGKDLEAQFSVAEAQLKHGADGNAEINDVVKTRTFEGPTYWKMVHQQFEFLADDNIWEARWKAIHLLAISGGKLSIPYIMTEPERLNTRPGR
jgi:hypothetical protein